MGSQQFCLRWNNHQSNMLNVFDQLLQSEALVDVTLACDGLSLKAHKVVLSACSPYFQALFLDNPCQHPIVFLKDVRYSDLKALVDFMYKGEVNVSQEQLNAVLETAESLKVKGLAEMTPEGPRGGPAYHVSKVIRNTASIGLAMSDTQTKDSGVPLATSPPPASPRPLNAACSIPDQMKRSGSPPAKRRKAKPRKRIPENAMPSDHEDSDALDLSTASPELLESCMDIHDGTYEPLSCEAKKSGVQFHVTGIGASGSNNSSNNNNSSSNQQSALHVDVDDNLLPHDRDFNSIQNQVQASSPSGIASQRVPIIPKIPQLVSVLSTAPLPSTSATQASIQDIRRLCQLSRQSQQHKPTWTEEDMVQALEAVQSGRLTYALAARKFDIPKATLHYYVILMKAVEAVRSGRMTAEIAAIKYNVRTTILLDCLFGRQGAGSGVSAGAATAAAAAASGTATEKSTVKREL